MLVDQLVVHSAPISYLYVSRSLGFSSCVRVWVVLTLSCFHACDFRVQTFFRSGFSSPEVHKSFNFGTYYLYLVLLYSVQHVILFANITWKKKTPCTCWEKNASVRATCRSCTAGTAIQNNKKMSSLSAQKLSRVSQRVEHVVLGLLSREARHIWWSRCRVVSVSVLAVRKSLARLFKGAAGSSWR